MRYIGEYTTALHIAASGGNLDVVEYLVKEDNADIEARDINGCTPLHSASHEDHLSVVEYLVRNGGDVNAVNRRGNTPFHDAASRGFVYLVAFFVRNGADTQLVDEEGYTIVELIEWLRSLAEDSDENDTEKDESSGDEEENKSDESDESEEKDEGERNSDEEKSDTDKDENQGEEDEHNDDEKEENGVSKENNVGLLGDVMSFGVKGDDNCEDRSKNCNNDKKLNNRECDEQKNGDQKQEESANVRETMMILSPTMIKANDKFVERN